VVHGGGGRRRCFAPELGLVRSPAEVTALAAAEQLGRKIWKIRRRVRASVQHWR